MRLIEKVQAEGWHLILVEGNEEENQSEDKQLVEEEQQVHVMPSDPIMFKSNSRQVKEQGQTRFMKIYLLVVWIGLYNIWKGDLMQLSCPKMP